MPVSQQETKNLRAISIGHGWISEGNGWYRRPMSDDFGITITKIVYPDGRTDFIFKNNASPTSNRVPAQ